MMCNKYGLLVLTLSCVYVVCQFTPEDLQVTVVKDGEPVLLKVDDEVKLNEIGGEYNGGETVISREGSPYLVKEDIVVGEGGVLVIEPGVTLRFRPGVGVHVEGVLLAEVTHLMSLLPKVNHFGFLRESLAGVG